MLYCCISCNGQPPLGTDHLTLEKSIEMPEVSGRIDHLTINLKDNLVYVAALGSNTVEVVDLNRGKVIHSIKGLDEPQGVCYLPVQNELVVANGGNGNCMFYNAVTYATIATVHLGSDADNVRYDAGNKKIYVGYGSGGIAVIDAATHQQTANIPLPVHPESLQIDEKNKLLFVNLPDNNSVAVIDMPTAKVIHTWKIDSLKANFPMALDTAGNSVIIGYRNPPMLVSYNATTGKERSRTALIGDVDDVFYYEPKQEIFASGGDGAINIFKKASNSGFTRIANIPTRSGARTSLLIPSLQRFVVAERPSGGKYAALAVYKIND
ncbi:YncE family protein [Ilyomonas limi]|uniref:YncE family protein n=1 Tax=Ilyomonas limi TaxID=2575867 RepID=A0A4U3LBC0_9BACT|nr:YncE family protein [Ilyomonas limi]